MKKRITAFLDNDSAFGRMMAWCLSVIGGNLMFVLFSLPVLTIGPALAALSYTMMRAIREEADINPAKEFWKGFRDCFLKALLWWILVLVLLVIGILDIRFTAHMGGILDYFRWAVYGVLGFLLVLTLVLYPVMAAFENTLPSLVRSALYFAGKNPLRAVLIALIQIGPLVLTYMDLSRLPLYAFLWSVCGFALTELIACRLLLPDFDVFLKKPEEEQEEA